MANPDVPQGARPFGPVLRSNEYVAGGAVYPGDLVKLNSDGRVVAATASDALLGVAIGWASAAAAKILVADHPDQQIIIQSDSADIDAQTDLGLNYNFVATAGDTLYKVSRMELDGDSAATLATLPLRALAVVEGPDNALGASVKLRCIINNHQLKGGTGTIGV